MSDIRVVKYLLNSSGSEAHTATGDGKWAEIPKVEKMNLEVALSPAGGTATVEIHGSNFGGVPGAGSLLVSFTLSGANDRSAQTKPDPGYLYMCSKVVSISGGASVIFVVGG